MAAYDFFLCLPITSIFSSTFSSATCFRKQVLRKMLPIYLVFLLSIVCKTSPTPWFFVTLLHFSHDRSNRSPPFFSNTAFQNFPGFSDLLSEVSKFQHHKKVCSKCSFSLKFKSNYPVTRAFLLSGNRYTIKHILSCPYLRNNITISNKYRQMHQYIVNSHFINTVLNCNLFQPLKCHLQEV